jgi:hypothetical protein
VGWLGRFICCQANYLYVFSAKPIRIRLDMYIIIQVETYRPASPDALNRHVAVQHFHLQLNSFSGRSVNRHRTNREREQKANTAVKAPLPIGTECLGVVSTQNARGSVRAVYGAPRGISNSIDSTYPL